MVVICPKCKVKLKVDEARLSAEGSRFKCPKCATVLVVKKPAAHEKKELDKQRVLVAHSKKEVAGLVESLLSAQGYKVVTATDGIEVMVKALKELPFLCITEVALPKIYGFEVCKRLKGRIETKDMKFILIPSIHDRTKYRREPVSLYGADEYVEEQDLRLQLIDMIDHLKGAARKEEPEKPRPAKQPETVETPAEKEPAPTVGQVTSNDKVEKAKRLARTIINDIYLYNTAKVDDAVRNDNFFSVFASEVKEGLKLYEHRIPLEVRNKEDYYRGAIEDFLAARKKTLV
ncbi:MAG: zinc-ribbon domain-containing protein [Nitrospiraceae bacterium]|nr:zinc-ribbon domain-containing protein [Nitrospiraceae bacterium]